MSKLVSVAVNLKSFSSLYNINFHKAHGTKPFTDFSKALSSNPPVGDGGRCVKRGVCEKELWNKS